ncbi:hypothetical protein ASG94_17370 [Nocardioides sp. Soil805]|nr:hypothetical protein ASG94_17370 [Nocardioides sp. Soil805]
MRCEGVVHLYRTFEGEDVVALRGLDLEILAGERVVFLGPSGSGKSTLMSLLGGIQRPSAGRIWLGDDDISRMSERRLMKLRAQQVSTMLQGSTRNLLLNSTASTNVKFARMGMDAAAREQAMPEDELLERVGLLDRRDQRVAQMSGGQRQRLALACAVATMPQLLLADEPTSALSHVDRDKVIELIHELGDLLGTTIVVVTHEPAVTESFPRTVTIKGGRVGSEGYAGAEYAVIGEGGVVHLPEAVGTDWQPGTLVRIEQVQRFVVMSHPDDPTAPTAASPSGAPDVPVPSVVPVPNGMDAP